MEVWFFITLIVFGVFFFEYKKTTTNKKFIMDANGQGVVQKELEQIKQRLGVLEKIITDNNYDLNEEFSQ